MNSNKILPVSFLVLVGIISISLACSSNADDKNSIPKPIVDHQFNAYWFDGKAEIAKYDLKQSRYGETRNGTATLIFVTEPFSKSKQVKLDDYNNKSDRNDVLKMNQTRKFNTGIYPYSIMTSAFSPLAKKGGVVKLTTSVQEWCGHTFLQYNSKGNEFHISGKSYFESEGDEESSIAKEYTEDELFNLLRMSPKNLPAGKFKILPTQLHSRFSHSKLKVENANAVLTKGDELSTYTLNYSKLGRSLTIKFDSQFPYTIQEWKEEITKNGKKFTTTATLQKSVRVDYWSKNANEYEGLFEKL